MFYAIFLFDYSNQKGTWYKKCCISGVKNHAINIALTKDNYYEQFIELPDRLFIENKKVA